MLDAVAIVEVQPPATEGFADAVLRGCTSALGTEGCFTSATDAPEGAALIVVRPDDATAHRVTIEVRNAAPSASRWVRELEFAADTPGDVRGVSVGLVVAALTLSVQREELAASALAAKQAEAEPPAARVVPVVVAEPPRPAPPPPDDPAPLGVSAAGGFWYRPAWNAVAPIAGGMGRVWLGHGAADARRTVQVLGTASLRYGRHRGSPQVTWTSASLGAGLGSSPDERVSLSLRVEAVAARLEVAAADADAADAESGVRWRAGGELSCELFVRVYRGFGVSAASGATLLHPRVHVEVRDALVGTDGLLGASGELALRLGGP